MQVGGDHVAYQVLGEGPTTLVHCTGIFSSIDARWDDPAAAAFYRELGSLYRFVSFDRRGTGASDIPSRRLTWEDYVDDIEAVVDDLGAESVALMAMTEAGPAAMQFAATRPERTQALTLFATYTRRTDAPRYDVGTPPSEFADLVDRMIAAWGRDEHPGQELFDPIIRHWSLKMQRATVPPGRVGEIFEMIAGIDARHVVPLVEAPTLLLMTQGRVRPHMEHLAAHLPKAETALVDTGTLFAAGEEGLRHIRRFLDTHTGVAVTTRQLAAVLFTDVVEPTATAQRLGDDRWRELLHAHDLKATEAVTRQGGRLVKLTGDGVMAIFDGPAKAIRAAADLRRDMREIDLEVRGGVHAGEVELRGDDVGGIGVHIAARVAAAARPGELLASRTVRDLVAGSGIEFEHRGSHVLKGLDEEWELYGVTAL